MKTLKEQAPLSLPEIVCAIFTLAVLMATLIPNLVRARPPRHWTMCKSNLKNLGTALEMYSTDYNGNYPKSLSLLTPKYLKTIPKCPYEPQDPYIATFGSTAAYNTPGYKNYYLLECPNNEFQPGYPQYDALQGLIEQ